jgi:DNA end-binding protein Ku
LIAAMNKSQRAAIAKFVMRGKEHLVLIRPYADVLMLHTMHYADEIRSSGQVDNGAKTAVGASELKLAERLIDELSKDKFEPEKFKDLYREKILKIAEQKAAGQEVAPVPVPKRGKVIDLMSALKDSLRGASKEKANDQISPNRRSGSHKETVHRAPRASSHPRGRRRARS